MKKVIITGCTGQTGSYMVDFLLKNTPHTVYGVVRRSPKTPLDNLLQSVNHPRFRFVHADLTQKKTIDWLVKNLQPDYFINFAGLTSPIESEKKKEETLNVNMVGVAYCLNAIHEFQPNCRFFNAGSSHEFKEEQFETQYSLSKRLAHRMVTDARERLGLFAIQGILFNHESERRTKNFIARKITSSVARIRKEVIDGKTPTPLEVGNINGMRGWMHAEDVVKGIWSMINQPEPIEYELSSPELYSIRRFISECFAEAGFIGEWQGKHLNEKYLLRDLLIDPATSHWWTSNREIITGVVIKPEFWQPVEDIIQPINFEAESTLNWTTSVKFPELVSRMVLNDIKLLDEPNS